MGAIRECKSISCTFVQLSFVNFITQRKKYIDLLALVMFLFHLNQSNQPKYLLTACTKVTRGTCMPTLAFSGVKLHVKVIAERVNVLSPKMHSTLFDTQGHGLLNDATKIVGIMILVELGQ